MTVPYDESNPNLRVTSTEDTILDLYGDNIHVRRDGPPGAHVLLLIHGSGSSTHSWDPLVPLLTATHHVVRVDLLGHGRSDKPADGDYEIVTQGRRIAAALDRLEVESVIVVGHSAGGYAATALVEQRPDLVTALVLVNTGPSMDAAIPQQGSIGPSQWQQLTDEQIRQAMSTGFSRPGYEPPPQLVQDVRRMTHHSFTTTMQASSAYIRQEPLPDRLKVLEKPLLVIYGADDRRWRPSFSPITRTFRVQTSCGCPGSDTRPWWRTRWRPPSISLPSPRCSPAGAGRTRDEHAADDLR